VHSDKLAISARQARGSEYVMEHTPAPGDDSGDDGATLGDAPHSIRRNLELQAVEPPDRASSQQVCLSLGPISCLPACMYTSYDRVLCRPWILPIAPRHPGPAFPRDTRQGLPYFFPPHPTVSRLPFLIPQNETVTSSYKMSYPLLLHLPPHRRHHHILLAVAPGTSPRPSEVDS